MTIRDLREAWKTPEFAGMVWALIMAYVSMFLKPLVLMNLWNWFMGPSIHGSDISYLQALMFVVFVYVVQLPSENNPDTNWVHLFTVLETLLPGQVSAEVKHAIKDGKGDSWKSDLGRSLGRIIMYAVILAAGWGLHVFFT
jgi:hypothetical protein